MGLPIADWRAPIGNRHCNRQSALQSAIGTAIGNRHCNRQWSIQSAMVNPIGSLQSSMQSASVNPNQQFSNRQFVNRHSALANLQSGDRIADCRLQIEDSRIVD
jgi:hypothetical protein